MSRGVLHLRLDARVSGTVAYLTVDNHDKLNSLDSALMSEFVTVIGSLAARGDLRALVLTGAGDRAFIGGANISEMAALDRDRAEDFIRLVHRTCDCLRSLPVPVIARIDGYALGAGLEVAVSCDLRVASSRAKFGMTEVRLGLPSVVEAALLPRLIGFGHTRELVLLGENIDAETALRWGLIERAVALCDGPMIRFEDLPEGFRDLGLVEPASPPSKLSTSTSTFEESMSTLAESKEAVEREQIAAALHRNGNNRLRAAADLGISRMTLYNKLHKFGLLGAPRLGAVALVD